MEAVTWPISGNKARKIASGGMSWKTLASMRHSKFWSEEKGHAYNLTPGKSKELSEALKSPTATPQQFLDTVLKDRRGSYVIFADPNWANDSDGTKINGIAIQNIAPSGFRCFLDGMFDVRQGRKTYERYGLVRVCENDSIIQLSPQENEEFFTDLMAFTD